MEKQLQSPFIKGGNIAEEIIDRIMTIPGWMMPIELRWLYAVSASLPAGGTLIETGAWRGRSSVALGLGAHLNALVPRSLPPAKTIVSIDTWQGNPGQMPQELLRQAAEGEIFNSYLVNMRQFGFDIQPWHCDATGLQYITGDSVASAALFKDDAIDVLFIDDDHYRCGEVIDAWWPKIKRAGGVISGHDYFCCYETIQWEIIKRFYVYEIIGSIWAYWRGEARPSCLPPLNLEFL